MIVWGGGSGASGTDQPTGAVYNPAANTWTPVSTSGAPTNSLFMYMVWSGSQMIVFSSGNNSLVASGGRYNPVNNTWSAMNLTGAPPPVEDATAIWTGSNMIVWGGFNYNTYNTLNTGASYNPTANTWTTISSVGAPLPREQHGAVWTGSKMIIWGGQDGDRDDYGDGGIYDPVANSWTPTPTNGAPIARDSHTMVWTGSDAIVWGGQQYELGFDSYYIYPEPGGLLYDYGLWFPMTDAPGTGEPGARENATAVWTGSEMLIWGGDNSGFNLRTGGNFNPTANSWTGIPTNNAPTGRTGHTAIWTGSNMVVWGGTDNSGTSATGGRYDPVMNMWSPVSTANAPAARTAHVAVWTGTQMLIWGGAEGGLINPFPPVGGRYNPFNDTWTPMNATSEPTPTASAAAAWTGTEMVVWGGVQTSFSGTTYFATGGRYNPASDSWILMSTNNAPSARSRHSAVWSGIQYIVFGGTNGVTNLNTGGLYTVTNDSWTPLSTNNAPPPSSGISTVWAGNEMITYGGYMGTNFGYSYFGDIYDPTANTWTPTLEFPSFGVANHCALWIDSGMLIWGGYAGPEVGYSDQTALYTPQRTMNLLLRP
jgi:N-acetylneuraminic acid mutarotase